MEQQGHWIRGGILLGCLLLLGTLLGTAQAADTIKIGVLTPLSPPGDASAGQLITRGARLAVDYVRDHGGIRGGSQIEVVVEDDAGTPEKGIAGYRKLATRDGVVAVIGQFHSSVMLAVSNLAERTGVPIFSTQASARSITEKHFRTTFRTHAIDPDRARVWLQFITEQGFKRIAILAENTDYGVGLIEETKAQNRSGGLGLELKPVIFDRGTVDLTPQLLELKAWNADLLINVGVGASAYLIIKQAYDIGLYPATPMLASYDFPVRPEFWNNLGDKGSHLLYISYYHPRMQVTPLGRWFQERYRDAYQEPPVYTAFNAFGQIVFISEALKRAASTQPADLITALESGEYLSWNGKVTFPRGEGPYWHQWSPPLLILQYTKPGQPYEEATILFPAAMKTGSYMAPR